MFKLIKNLFLAKPPDMVHPFFGPLDAECDGSPDDRWHGEMPSPMDGDNRIGVCILAGKTGPTEGQVNFWVWISTQFEEVLKLISPLLEENYRDRTGCSLEEGLEEEYTLCSVMIPKNGNRNEDWDIAFSSQSDKGEHAFEVRFEKGIPVSIGMDG